MAELLSVVIYDHNSKIHRVYQHCKIRRYKDKVVLKNENVRIVFNKLLGTTTVTQ